MKLGTHLRELAAQRVGLALSLLLAVFVAASLGYRVSLLPPGLQPRSIDMASASTQVLVDTPRTAVLDMRQGTAELQSMSNRALLIGNMMASLPLRDYIARRARIPAAAIRATTPLTPEFPRPIAGAENQKHTTDILRSPREYRLNVQANPTVPILDISTQAPSAQAAAELANATVDGMRDYLSDVARAQTVRPGSQVRLEQLGRARGVVIDHGARLQIVVLGFVLTFGLCCALVVVLARLGARLAARPPDEVAA
jgi:hypothetical protein